MTTPIYDCIIIGGGIAGLSLSICLAKAKAKVLLFEKETYPFHKVCGEYISNESRPFLESLGIDFSDKKIIEIENLLLTSPYGIAIKRSLDIGGIGISRFELDNQLYRLALAAGVEIRTNTKVIEVNYQNNYFDIKTSSDTVQSKTTVGAFGKNSNIDVKLNRNGSIQKISDPYVAVKYHIYANYDKNTVEIHSFSGGYCGLSSIENDKVNMSYICRASYLKSQKTIANLEKNVLSTNPYLRRYFQNATFIYDKPLTISNLYFEINSPTSNHILMIGDAAGRIAPLSGNGMSIGLLSAKICYESILQYLNQEISHDDLEQLYTHNYTTQFSKRISTAKTIHKLLGKKIITDIGFCFLKVFPFAIDQLSKKIRGNSF
jgi:menaquinone-9 beta-reductase